MSPNLLFDDSNLQVCPEKLQRVTYRKSKLDLVKFIQKTAEDYPQISINWPSCPTFMLQLVFELKASL